MGAGWIGGRGSHLRLSLALLAALAGPLLAQLWMGVANAQTASPGDARASTPTSQQATPSGQVSILVLDMSGSMGRPGQGGNDPDGLRCSAAHAYIDLSGPGQWVGIVGLSHPGTAPGDALTAQDYAQPAEMSTDAARAAMWQALETRSNKCVGDGTTPMADALARADHMLQQATRGGTLSGSVILLTDGLPDPSASAQIAQIKGQLPDFESHNWPINTIALGDADRGFLRGLSDATGGTAYDVAHGPVAGVSPLNLEPFFVDIFRVNSGRTLLHAVSPTTLQGPLQRPFHVGRFIAHMDVLVVRDSANVGVQLYAPGNYPNSPEQPGQARIVQSDPHYAIFSIDAPVRGDWVLGFSGAGQVLTDALLQSSLSLQLVSPRANQHLPIGLPLAVDAALRDGQDQVLAEPVTLTASLGPANGADQTSREVPLTDPGGGSPTGNFQGKVTIPSGAPHGTYHITLQALLNDASVNLVVPVVFEAFPTPTLLSPANGHAQLSGLALDAVPGAPLTVAFGLTVDGTLEAEPHVSATLTSNGQPIALSTFAGTWQATYIPAAAGAQPLLVRLSGSYHGTDLAAWTYTLPLSVTLRPTLSVVGIDARRPYPAHRTVSVTLAYFRQAGVPDPSAAGHITATLLPPDGIGVPLGLLPAQGTDGQPDPGAFTAALSFGAPGTYTLHAVFDDGVASDHSEQLYVLRVIDFPIAVTAQSSAGDTLTSWGPLGGLYSLPVVSWLSGLPLAGSPSQPTAAVSGQVLLGGQPYTVGTIQAVAHALGGSRSVPAQVSRSGASYVVRFQPPAAGAYQVVVTWVGDFAGLHGDQEATVTQVDLAIAGPGLGGWARAWVVTLAYLLLLALLLQSVRYSLTPAPAGALQSGANPADLYPLDRPRAPLWRRFLQRNVLRTSDVGLPPGGVLRFRRHRDPLVTAERGGHAGVAVYVGGAELRPGGQPVPLEGGESLRFRQDGLGGDEGLDGFDELDGGRSSGRRERPSRRDARRDDDGIASSYVYLTPAEVRERTERDDPLGGMVAAVEEADDPYGDSRPASRSWLGHVGALFAALRPLPKAREADDLLGDDWAELDDPGTPRGRGRRRGSDPLDDLNLDLDGGGSRRGRRRTTVERGARGDGRRRSSDYDDLDWLDD